MTKSEYETVARNLIGEIVQKVEYFEVKYDGYETDFDDEESFDSLDYGANLMMDSGKIFGFIWGDEFYQYGVSILSSPLQSEASEWREVDVSKSSKWNRLIGKEIVTSEVDWGWVKKSGLFKKKIFYPQSIVLTFEDGSLVVISALEVQDNSHFGLADNITVFFNKESALRYGALSA